MNEQMGSLKRFQGIWPNQAGTEAGKGSAGYCSSPDPCQQHLPASFQLATHVHSEPPKSNTELQQYLSTLGPMPQPLLNADTPVVCLLTVIILKMPLFSLLERKSSSHKRDLQNNIKCHPQLKGHGEPRHLSWQRTAPIYRMRKFLQGSPTLQKHDVYL